MANSNWKGKSGGKKFHGKSSKAIQSKKDRDKKFKSLDPYGVKPEPFPRVLLTRMKYMTQGQLTTGGANIAAAHTYRMNSIYDPYFAAGGTTTVGHATMAGIYDQYWVMGAKCILSFNNPTVDGTRVGYRLRINSNGSALGQTLKGLGEQPLTYLSGLNDSGKQVKNFSFYVHPWTLCGVSKLEYLANSSTYSSVMSGNPAANSTCVVDIISTNAYVNTTVNYTMKIVYYTKLFSRKSLISSIVA